MTNEQSFFITALSDHLHGRKSSLPDGLDCELLLSIAREQQLGGILFVQTGMEALERRFYWELLQAANRRKLLEDIHSAFNENDIPYILIKGTEIARFYPQPELRTMGDSDILVHEADKEKAAALLVSMGFTVCKKSETEWLFLKNGVAFELHHRLLYDESVNLAPLKSWTDRVWEFAHPEEGTRFAVSNEFHFVFLLLHLRKHFLNSGVGFRQFMDVAVLSRQPLDWDTVRGFLTELELDTFSATCFGLCKLWFDCDFPFSATLSPAFAERTEEGIFAGGVFGYLDEDNKRNRLKFQLQKSTRLAIFFKNIFISYADLRHNEKYAFLNGRPYLLPAAWLYRIFLVFKEGRVSSATQNTFAPFTTSKNNERIDWIRQWGLLE